MTAYTIFRHQYRQAGFTLVEMAMVLLIIALLLGGLMPTISGQVEQRRTAETKAQLEQIKEALIGYAIINGRLPCPASSTSGGAESFAAGSGIVDGNCSNFYSDSFIPAATLGLSGTDSSGYVVDAWNNRIRYAVTKWQSSSSYVFTRSNGMRSVGISSLGPTILICASTTAASFNGSSCGTNNSLTSAPGVPTVLFSTGKNGASGGAGADEAANLDNNQTFVYHTPTTTTGNEFDDLMTWISPNVLVSRMVAAGQLP